MLNNLDVTGLNVIGGVTEFGIVSPLTNSKFPVNQQISFIADGADSGEDYLWDMGDGTPELTGQTVTHTYDTVGDYTVTCTSVKDGEVVTDSIDIDIGNLPLALIVTPVSLLQTFGEPIAFSCSSESGASYSWDMGDESTRTGASFSYTYTSGDIPIDTYTVTLTAHNDYGTTSDSIILELAKPAVAVIVSPLNNEGKPVNTVVNIVAQAQETGLESVCTYSWLTEGEELVGRETSYTYTNVGLKTIQLNVDNGHGKISTASITINVQTFPTIRITSPTDTNQYRLTDILFNAEISSADSFVWSFGDTATSEDTNPTTHSYNLDSPNTVTATLTATNSAGSISDSITLNLSNPMFIWMVDNTPHNLGCIRVGSRSGWTGNTGELKGVSNSDYTGEIYTFTNNGRRTISLTIPIHADSLSAKQTALKEWQSIFAQNKAGTFIFTYEDGTQRAVIDTRVAQGYPQEEYVTDKFSWLSVNLVSFNPYWYHYGTAYTLDNDNKTVNDGDMSVGLSFTAIADTVTNTTTNQSITAVSGQTIIGLSFVITDDSISVMDSENNNCLWKCDIESEFFKVIKGENTITGTSNLRYYPKWGGV